VCPRPGMSEGSHMRSSVSPSLCPENSRTNLKTIRSQQMDPTMFHKSERLELIVGKE
jgi:hypothetical protein